MMIDNNILKIDFDKLLNKIPHQVIYIIRRLEQFGWEGYLVGGSIRDLLLGKKPYDYDITSNCPLEEIKNLFSNVKIVGAAFGVALVKLNGMEIQIARFRNDGQYSDNRHPDNVQFTDRIMEDLQRRDFTINAIAYDLQGLKYIDGALDDLNNGIIRAVKDPLDRFTEDSLRMLRAIRFSCQLGFNVHGKTVEAIYKSSNLIQNISMERIQEELNKILVSQYAAYGILDLYDWGLLQYIIPELLDCYDCWQNVHHEYDVFHHITNTVGFVPNDLSLRLTALFHDIGKPQTKTTDEEGHIHFYGHDEVSENMTEQILRRLKYDNDSVNEVVYLVRNHMELMNYDSKISKQSMRKLLNRHGELKLKKLIEFRRADLLGSGTRDEQEVEELIQIFRSKLEETLEEKPPTKLIDLAIDGNDIMECCGLLPGKEVGMIKNYLMNCVLEDPTLNNKEALWAIMEGFNGNSSYCRDIWG